MRVLRKYILLASVMLTTNVTPSIAEIDCRKLGEATERIYKMYKKGEHVSDVMDVIDSRGLGGLTKRQSRILALSISENMDYFTFITVSEVRRFYEQDCFEAKYN